MSCILSFFLTLILLSAPGASCNRPESCDADSKGTCQDDKDVTGLLQQKVLLDSMVTDGADVAFNSRGRHERAHRSSNETLNAVEASTADWQNLVSLAYPSGSWNPRERPISAEDREHVAASDGGENDLCTRGPSTYGELTPQGFHEILKAAQGKPAEVFYDLGAGLGKGMLVAWSMGLEAKGVELSHEEFEYACERLAHAVVPSLPLASAGLTMIENDFLRTDFSDANLIFIDSVCFPVSVMEQLADRFHSLKLGTRVITLKELPKRSSFKFKTTIHAPVTWRGNTYPVLLYEVGGCATKDCVHSEFSSHVDSSLATHVESCSWIGTR